MDRAGKPKGLPDAQSKAAGVLRIECSKIESYPAEPNALTRQVGIGREGVQPVILPGHVQDAEGELSTATQKTTADEQIELIKGIVGAGPAVADVVLDEPI